MLPSLNSPAISQLACDAQLPSMNRHCREKYITLTSNLLASGAPADGENHVYTLFATAALHARELATEAWQHP